MTARVNIGILGGGANSAVGHAHLSALRMDGRFQIRPSLFSHIESENIDSHKEYGVCWNAHASSATEWLERNIDNIDLVAILTPSTLHLDHIREVSQFGVSFVCEKPVACSCDELTALKALLASGKSYRSFFVHNYSGYPMFRELVLRVKNGDIGKLHHVRLVMPSDGFASESIVGRPQLWRQSDPQIPMIMLDLGTHLHHLSRMILGRSKASVMAWMNKMVNSFNVVDNVEIWEEREDGVSVSYWMSKAHLGIKNGLTVEVYGSLGSLAWHQMNPDILSQADLASNVTVVHRGSASKIATYRDRFKAGHPTGFVEAFANFYSDLADEFLGATLDGSTPKASWIRPMEEAMDGIEFLLAASESYSTRSWVSL